MKISPVAGPSLGSVTSTTQPTVDRKEAAKAAFMGQERPVETLQSAKLDPNARRIRMRTNYSPDRFEEELQQEVAAAPTETSTESVVSDEGKQAVESEVTRPISPQFAELARQRRALQVKEREITEKAKALEEKLNTRNSVDLEQLRSNPLGVLLNAGVTYEQLTEAVLNAPPNGGIDPKVKALEEKIAELEKGVEQKFQTKEAQAEEAALTEMLHEAKLLAKDGENYEMIREKNAYEKVLREIYSHYKKTGQVLEVKSVMDKLEEEFVSEAAKYGSFKKVQSRLTPEQEAQASAGVATNKLKTLTNRQTASTPLSAKARAIAAFNGTLKR